MSEEEQLQEAIRRSEIENENVLKYEQELNEALRMSEIAPLIPKQAEPTWVSEQRKALEDLNKNKPVTLSQVANVIDDYFKEPEPPGVELERKLKAQMESNNRKFLAGQKKFEDKNIAKDVM